MEGRFLGRAGEDVDVLAFRGGAFDTVMYLGVIQGWLLLHRKAPDLVTGVSAGAIAAAAMADAQGIATSFNELRFLVKPGDTIRVTSTGGAELTGRLVDLSSASLVLATGNDSREWQESDVARIRQGGAIRWRMVRSGGLRREQHMLASASSQHLKISRRRG